MKACNLAIVLFGVVVILIQLCGQLYTTHTCKLLMMFNTITIQEHYHPKVVSQNV